jgi:MFS transporter, PPP family, 3-phenylpropionic acid transporter
VSPQQRIAVYFFCQFMSGGAANAFGGIWLAQQNFSTNQIGLFWSLPLIIIVCANVFVGRIADRLPDWRQTIVLGACVSAIVPTGLFWSESFLPILLLFTIPAVAQNLIVPVTDAAALAFMREKGGNLGSMRALSSAGYIVTLLAMSWFATKIGPAAYIPVFVAFSWLRAGTSFLLPHFKQHLTPVHSETSDSFATVLKPEILLPLLGWSIVYATHLVLNGFQALLWSNLGYSNMMVGTFIAIGATSEALAFFLYRLVPKTIDLRLLILLSGLVTVARWYAMSHDPSLPIVLALQLLHGVTFALGFLACVNFIADRTSIANAAEVQSTFTMLQQVAAIAVITIFSYLAGEQGSGAYFGNALMALAGTLVISAAFFRRPRPTINPA